MDVRPGLYIILNILLYLRKTVGSWTDRENDRKALSGWSQGNEEKCWKNQENVSKKEGHWNNFVSV